MITWKESDEVITGQEKEMSKVWRINHLFRLQMDELFQRWLMDDLSRSILTSFACDPNERDVSFRE